MSKIRIDRVSPVAGALLGGNTVTLTGSGFGEKAVVYFGNQLATEINFEAETTVKAVVPEATASGSVPVTIVNPDGNLGQQAATSLLTRYLELLQVHSF